MKLTTLSTAVLGSILPVVQAHYFFDVLINDGVASKSNEFIRSNTRTAKYNPTKWVNTRDDTTPDGPEMRCNKGAFESAVKTSTASVAAGSKLAFKLAVGATMQHPGPALVYMSKSATTAQADEGAGDWFKIFETGVCDKTKDFTTDAWCTWDKDNVEFTIPKDVPNGDYLIRAEHIGVHGAHTGQAEFYMACAQVTVTGGGSGTPGPTIKFPGGYKKDDPSFNFSIYGGYKEYPMPGPAVWSGGSGSNSSMATVVNAVSTTAPASSSTSISAPIATETSSGNNDEDTDACEGPSSVQPRGRAAFLNSLRQEQQ